jgi:hypothetical protein
MRILITCLLLGFFCTSFAQESQSPFSLQNGLYSFECWNSRVDRTKSGDLVRSSFNGKGTREVARIDGTLIETNVWDSIPGKQIVSTKSKSLTNGLFLQTVENSVFDHSDVVIRKTSWELKIKVDGHFIQFLSSKMNGGPEVEEKNEFSWQEMPDGRVIASGYLREPHGTYTQPDGTELSVVVSNTFCVFTPKSK